MTSWISRDTSRSSSSSWRPTAELGGDDAAPWPEPGPAPRRDGPPRAARRPVDGGRRDHHRPRTRLGQRPPPGPGPRVRVVVPPGMTSADVTAGSTPPRARSRRGRARRPRSTRARPPASRCACPSTSRPGSSRRRPPSGSRSTPGSSEPSPTRRRHAPPTGSPERRRAHPVGGPAPDRLGPLQPVTPTAPPTQRSTAMPTFATPRPIDVSSTSPATSASPPATAPTPSSRSTPPTRPRPPTSAAAEATVEHADGRLPIRTPKNWRRFTPFDRGGSVQVTVEVPTGSTVEASSALGDLQADGELGRCRVKDGHGQHPARPHRRRSRQDRLRRRRRRPRRRRRRRQRPARARSAIGRIDGTAAVKNSNGDIAIGEVTGDAPGEGRQRQHRDRAGAGVGRRQDGRRLDRRRRGPPRLRVLETSAGDLSLRHRRRHRRVARRPLEVRHGAQRPRREPTAPRRADEVLEVRAAHRVGDITLIGRSDRAPTLRRPDVTETPTPRDHDRPGSARPSATRSCSTASTSRSPRARSSPCSGPTAPARRPWSTS